MRLTLGRFLPRMQLRTVFWGGLKDELTLTGIYGYFVSSVGVHETEKEVIWRRN